jgi:hypothetical protein
MRLHWLTSQLSVTSTGYHTMSRTQSLHFTLRNSRRELTPRIHFLRLPLNNWLVGLFRTNSLVELLPKTDFFTVTPGTQLNRPTASLIYPSCVSGLLATVIALLNSTVTHVSHSPCSLTRWRLVSWQPRKHVWRHHACCAGDIFQRCCVTPPRLRGTLFTGRCLETPLRHPTKGWRVTICIYIYILSRDRITIDEIWVGDSIYWSLQVVTTYNYNTIAISTLSSPQCFH